MVIEIKTTINKDKMKEAIENIRSVKRLDFIRSQVLTLKSSHPGDPKPGYYELQPTSTPLGAIFGLKSETSNFETYESWIKPHLRSPKSEIFDVCYLLNYTFHHAFPDPDYKNDVTRGIFGIEGAKVQENSEEYRSPTDNRTYPVVRLNGNSYAVEPSRGILNFIKWIYDLLSLKQVIQTSIFLEYMPTHLTKSFISTQPTFWSSET